MKRTVFYSWQSDLPNNTNRTFLEQALESATKAIRRDDSVELEPVLDRDTSGIAGSPEISNTILRKIDACAVLVADVSIINPGARSRRAPNPNVLIELGYALKSLGPERIVMVMNSHYGGPETLPFDLRLRRVLTYRAAPDDTDRADVRRDLAKRLEDQLRTVLDELERSSTTEPEKTVVDALIQAIRSKADDRTFIAREYMEDFYGRLFALAPSPPASNDEALVIALTSTTALVVEFARVCNVVAAMNDELTAEALYASFGRLLAKYDLPYGSDGTYRESDFDFHRFMGHELFVSFISPLLHEKRLSLLKRLLGTDIEMPIRARFTGLRTAPFHDLQAGTWLLRARTQRLRLISSHARLLHDRHSEGELASVSSFDHFMGADYFLFLHTDAGATDDQRVTWFPLTAVYYSQRPTFLERLHRNDFAIQIANLVGLPGSDELRTLVKESSVKIRRAFGMDWSGFAEASDPALIGSR